jgi:RNA polymerase-binding transcription factor DksA
VKNSNTDKLRQNYENMDETGKELLKETVNELKKIWEMKMMKKLNNRMTNQEINAWAILIAVIKNLDKDYEIIESLLSDIHDIKELIKTFD